MWMDICVRRCDKTTTAPTLHINGDWDMAWIMAATIILLVNWSFNRAFIEARWLHGTVSISSNNIQWNRIMNWEQRLTNFMVSTPSLSHKYALYCRIIGRFLWLMDGCILKDTLLWNADRWKLATRLYSEKSKYFDNGLYHSKAGYLKIGNEDVFSLSHWNGLENGNDLWRYSL